MTLHPFVISSIALAATLCAIGLACSALPRLAAATRHSILSASLLAPLLAIAIAAFDPPNPFASHATNGAVDVAITDARLADATPSTLPTSLPLFVWLAGLALLVTRTLIGSLRWSRIARRATPLHHAAFDAKRRLAISDDAHEPMVVGIVRPVVLIPPSFLNELDARELAGVFAHELAHVRRRDNATALLHELTCALFWFDPLHWIARRRLLALRERACDEHVLEQGCDARAYASALAKSGHAAIDSAAVACMSGIHVRERMENLMSYASNRTRFLSARIVRTLAAMLTIAIAITFALIAPAPPAFAQKIATNAEPISLNLKDADINDVAKTFGELLGRSISIEAEPQGRVTIDLIDVPWDTALARVAAQAGLVPVLGENGNIRLIAAPPTEHVGGDVKAPVLINRVDPIYPEEAKTAGIFGIVIVEATIDENGIVRSVKVLKALEPSLDRAAIDAVRQWKFKPGTKNDKPVPVLFNLTINFRLD